MTEMSSLWLTAILLLAIWLTACQVTSATSSVDLDPNDNLDDDEFRAKFGLEELTDPEERKFRLEALKDHEEIVKRQNVKYSKGKRTWYDKMNEFSDLTDEETIAEKTGMKRGRPLGKRRRGRSLGLGLFAHGPAQRDERSEKWFAEYRLNRRGAPSSYSSVDKGIVSPVKNQKQCGSCVAFATIAVVETCFKKITGMFGDYSEQELVDCGYRKNMAMGCRGAQCYSYAKWIKDSQRLLASERSYPYLNSRPRLRCPRENPLRQGARVTDFKYTDRGDEESLKQLVYEQGSVLIAVAVDSTFSYYAGGILSGCSRNYKRPCNHAVAVVGYGTERGQDFWLIKNSWGSWWGEKGYMRLKRGVNACGIGYYINTIECGRA